MNVSYVVGVDFAVSKHDLSVIRPGSVIEVDDVNDVVPFYGVLDASCDDVEAPKRFTCHNCGEFGTRWNGHWVMSKDSPTGEGFYVCAHRDAREQLEIQNRGVRG